MPATSDPSTTRQQRSPSPTSISTYYPSNEPDESSKAAHAVRSNDSAEKSTPQSVFYRPNSSRTDFGNQNVDRRPSAASATTQSSQGSKSSAGARFRKHLPRIFGEDYKGSDTGNASDSNLPPDRPSWERSSLRSRKNRSSGNEFADRPISPGGTQANAPAPTSEVTPWMYQSFHVSFYFIFISAFSSLLLTHLFSGGYS